MKKLAGIVGILTMLMVVGGFLSNNQKAKFVKGELLVKYKPTVSAEAVRASMAKMKVERIKEFPHIGAVRVKLPPKLKVEEAIERFKADPNIEYAEPNYILELDITVPNDPRFNELWGLHNIGGTGGIADADIDAAETWDTQTGDDTVLISIIDTGVDYNHEDLAANMWTNPGEVPADGIDNDGNTYVDDVRGWDFINGDNDPMDDHDHGTHVAGIVGAVGNNNIGITGVNWRVRMLPLKFMKPVCAQYPQCGATGPTSGAIDAVIYAVNEDARIINASWGGTEFSQALKDAIVYADSLGVLFVAAAGNDATDNDSIPHYPSNYGGPPHNVPNVIAVAATDHNDNLAAFSNYGKNTVHLGAPGKDILSTVRNNGYKKFSGTSMAAPHVAGVAGLVWAQFPTLTHYQVKDKILDCVDVKPSLTGRVITDGRLNAHGALTCPVASSTSNQERLAITSDSPTVSSLASLLIKDPESVLASIKTAQLKPEFQSQAMWIGSYYLLILLPIAYIFVWKAKLSRKRD